MIIKGGIYYYIHIKKNLLDKIFMHNIYKNNYFFNTLKCVIKMHLYFVYI
jgi:hypothetical protein